MPELLLPRLKQEIEARLAELRPVVEEYEQLEAAKRALLEEAAARTRRSAVPPSRILPREEPRSARLADRPAAPANGADGANGAAKPAATADPEREAIIAIVDERPGVSIAEIVAVAKLDKALVAATVSRLKREGVLADEAGGVKLASRQPVTLAGVAA